MDPTADILGGNIGFFWPQARTAIDLDDANIERGYLRLGDDSLIELRSLDEGHSTVAILIDPAPSVPLAIFGSTEDSGILIPHVMSARRTSTFGGSKSSVRRYRARALITAVDLRTARSRNLTSASLVFAKGLDFAALETLRSEITFDRTTNTATEAKFILKADPAASGGKYGAFDLVVEPDWSTSKNQGTTNLNTGLAITLTVKRPRPFEDYMPLFIGIQDLINVAYDVFVQAISGRAVVHGAATGSARSHLWLHDTMAQPAHRIGAAQKTDARPLFRLSDIGGSAGLRRWLTLRDRFPDVAQAVSSGYRHGGSRQPARLLELAAALEIYVASHRRSAAWARKATAPTPGEALARRIGKSFLQLTGDYSKWGERVQATYNSLKHDPTYARDPDELNLLSWSIQVALLVELLNRAARSKQPTRTILGDYRLDGNRDALRRLLGT